MPSLIPAPATVTASGAYTGDIDEIVVNAADPGLAEEVRRFLDTQPSATRWRAGETTERGFVVDVRREPVAAPVRPRGVRPRAAEVNDESYRLQVAEAGAQVSAGTATGVYRALTTLQQLLDIAQAHGRRRLPILEIVDAPTYRWRGLSLDVVRRFFPLAEVKRIIDLLSYYKLNVLHLHLSDDEGWRIEIPDWPRLTTVGAQGARGERPGGHYSTADYDELVAYAAQRHITIVPEVDLPGHSRAVFAAYPELVSNVVLPAGVGDGDELEFVALDPSDDTAMNLLRDVVEHLARHTPGDFIHIGADEAWGMSHEAYTRFIERAREFIHAAGKRMIAWQESARASVHGDDLIQQWIAFDVDSVVGEGFARIHEMTPARIEFFSSLYRGADADARRAVEGGASLILSPTGLTYLDTPYAEPSTDPGQEDDRSRLGMVAYDRSTVADAFAWTPDTFLPDLDPERDIAGVEAAIWCETVNDLDDLGFLILPRLPGVSEKAWSRPSEWDEYRDRLADHGRVWDEQGWNFFSTSAVDWR